jgi:hypothetical protein
MGRATTGKTTKAGGTIMNKYGAVWQNLELVVDADTTYQAQQLAQAQFQAKAGRRKVKGYEITVALLELDGKEYTHTAS